MNSENPKKIKQSGNYNWKGVMDFIKEEVKTNTTDWSNEKNILMKKISDLEKEVKMLKKTNQELLGKVGLTNNNPMTNPNNVVSSTPNNYFNPSIPLNGININPSLTLDRKLIAEKLLHKRGDSDKISRQDIDKFFQFRKKSVKTKQNSDDITKSDVLKKIYMRKTNSFGGFEKLFENKLLENNAIQNKYSTNYRSNNNINSGLTTTNKIVNGGGANYSNYATAINTNILNTVSNTASTPRILITNPDEISQTHGLISNRVNHNSNQNLNTLNPRSAVSNTKVTDFAKVISYSLSEKEEESSIATQETIEKRPNNFMNTSSSQSQNISNNNNTHNNTANLTAISVETKIFNDSHEKFIKETVKMIPDANSNINSNLNKNSNVNYNNNLNNNIQNSNRNTQALEYFSNTNDMRKSISSMYTSNRSKSVLDTMKSPHNPICILKYHLDTVRDVYLTPNKQTLVSIGEDMLINYWDFNKVLKHSKDNLEPYFSLRTHTTPIFNLTGPKTLNCNTNDQCTIYSSGIDAVIRCNRIIPIDFDRSLSTEDIAAKTTLQPWRAHQDMIWHLNCHPTQSLLSSLSSDGTVKIFKTYETEYNSDKFYYSNKSRSKSNTKQLSFRNYNHNFIEIPTSSTWLENSINQIYVSYITPYIKLFDIETGKSVVDFNFSVEKNIPFEYQQTNKLLYHETSNMLLSGHEDRQIRFFDPNQNKLIKSITAHTDSVSSLSCNGNEHEFISGSHDGSIRCWDLRIFKLLFDIPAHRKKFDEGCTSIRYIKDENMVITTGADGLIKIFKFN